MRLCRYPITLNNIGKRLLSLYNNNELSSYVTVTEINNNVSTRPPPADTRFASFASLASVARGRRAVTPLPSSVLYVHT